MVASSSNVVAVSDPSGFTMVTPALPMTVKTDTLRLGLTLVDEPQYLSEGYRFALRVHPPPFSKTP